MPHVVYFRVCTEHMRYAAANDSSNTESGSFIRYANENEPGVVETRGAELVARSQIFEL